MERKHTVRRTLAISILTLLPAGIGVFHLFVFPLTTLDTTRYNRYRFAVTGYTESQPSSQLSAHEQERERAISKARLRLAMTFPLVFSACMVVSLLLGLLDVSHSFITAVLLAITATWAHLIYDGQGACFGPIAFAIPFWLLIGLGKLIRDIIHRKQTV